MLEASPAPTEIGIMLRVGSITVAECDLMASQTATLAAQQQHGPMASAVKWAFKSYFQARQAIDDIVAEARAELVVRRPSQAALPMRMPPTWCGNDGHRDSTGGRAGARVGCPPRASKSIPSRSWHPPHP